MTTIYVIEPREALVRAALRAGVDVVPLVAAERSESSVPVVVIDTTDPVAIGRLIASGLMGRRGSSAVCMGPTDKSCLTAASVNEALGLRLGGFFDSTVLRRMLDKAETRRAIDAGCPELNLNPRWCVAETVEDAIAFLEESPVVVKPRTGSGSRGVHMVQDEVGLRSLNVAEFPAIVEEQIVGSEFSVETMSYEGRHTTLAITGKTTGGCSGVVEVRHVQPADLDAGWQRAVDLAVASALTAVGHSDGLAHTEVIVTGDGAVKLVETHGRAGGDMIVDMIGATLGMSAYDVLFRTISEARIPECRPTGVQARVFFPDLQHTRLAPSAISSQLYRHPAVTLVRFLKPQTAWGPVGHSGDRHCLVMAEGSPPDLDEVQAIVEHLETMTTCDEASA